MFQELLEKLAVALEDAGIPYMVIGGQAVLLYGEPRLTRDIDITLGVGPGRLSDVLQVVERISLKVLVKDAQAFVRRTMVLPCLQEETGIRVDLVFSFSPYERGAIERAKPVKVGQTTVYFTSVEDLIIHKLIAGRPRDLEDVRTVLLKNPQVDVDYIRRWLGEFEQATGEPYRERFERLWRET